MRHLAMTLVLVTFVHAPSARADNPVTPIGDLRRGMVVTLEGTVARITDDDEFRLADTSGSVAVYVGPNMVPATVGERITVEGIVDDDPGPLELYARRLIRANGQEVVFEQRYD